MSLEQYLVPYSHKKQYAAGPAQAKTGVKPKRDRPKGVEPGYKTNPCVDCQLHIARCPWLHEGKPVPGWDAEPVRLILASTQNRQYVADTWHILRCPLYIPPERPNEQDGTDVPYWDNLRAF